MNKYEISEKIYRICKLNGITRAEFAIRASVSERQASRYLNGQCNFSIKILNRIAKGLNVSVNKLL